MRQKPDDNKINMLMFQKSLSVYATYVLIQLQFNERETVVEETRVQSWVKIISSWNAFRAVLEVHNSYLVGNI